MSIWNQFNSTPKYVKVKSINSSISLLCMEFIRAFILLMGILSHSFNKTALNWSRVAGAFRRPLTLLSSSFHRCSIGDKSGLYGCQSSGLMLWLARKSWQTLATWGRALSCWKIRWCCCTNGTATGRRISSLYLTSVKLPAITINGDFKKWTVTHLWKRPISIASLEIVWDHVPPTKRATCTSERKTNVRSTSSQTKLTQSVSHRFWVNVAIMIAYRS